MSLIIVIVAISVLGKNVISGIIALSFILFIVAYSMCVIAKDADNRINQLNKKEK